MEFITKNSLGIAEYDRIDKVVYYKFAGLVSAEKGREVMQGVVAFAAKNQVKGAFTDCTELKGTFTNLNDYIVNEYFPPMIKQGLVCVAIVVSPDVFTQFAANSLIQKMGNFTIRNFRDIIEAKAWVIEQVSTN